MQKRYTIRVSDDHPHILNSLKMLFSSSELFSLQEEFTNGKDLLASLSDSEADIVITDFSLGADISAVDGFTRLRALNMRFPKVKVVLLTSQNNAAILRKACDYGVRAIVSKSDEVEETMLACHHILTHTECYFSSSLIHLSAMFKTGMDKPLMLTPRELEVVRLFSQGYSLADIAKRQNRTISTVSTQKYNAMRRLGISSNIELIRYAYAQGLI